MFFILLLYMFGYFTRIFTVLDRNSDSIANTNKVKKTDNVKDSTNVKKTESGSGRNSFRCIASGILKKEDKNLFGNRIIVMGILTTLVSMFCCPECHLSGIIVRMIMKRTCFIIYLLYLALYDYGSEFCTSKLCGKGYNINCRTVYIYHNVDKVIALSKNCAINDY